ncbi:alpha/beta fold hydrolase [Agromyces sp. CFH 90414]|uniref:Alpha/beta fold hydrolase n=1 Tax=Agromyces agglutinans TaxID=2662258 RepID=A0A6I2F7J5_9MICO|nr:alpha/beta fold hydrolase [Agromyces agglutinans]MRG60281.1 alpha/beta fold hydrolase [Agromyces agglutinans]
MSGGPPQRVAVEFESSGQRIAAVVYGVDGAADAPVPAVLICTGFGGTQDTPSIVAAAEAFAAEGWLAMTFDYRSFGLSAGEPRQVVSVPRQLDDIRAAIAHLRDRPEVDPDRVALWGSSLGGGHAITVASDDPRLAGVVAQVPFNGFPKHVEGRSTKDAYALLWIAVRDRVRGWMGRPPLYVKAVGDAGERAIMVGGDSNRTIEVLTGGTWRNEVAPRGLLDMMAYRPGRRAARIQAPLLVCIGEFDRETQGPLTEPLARDAPRGELRSYPFGHFDIYRPEIRVRVLADQVEFLRRAFSGSR